MAEWANLKVVELKAELKRRGLAQAGLKAELVARLEAADEETAAPDVDIPDADDANAEPAGTEPEPAGIETEPAGTEPEPAGTEPEPAPMEHADEARATAHDSIEAPAAVPSDPDHGHGTFDGVQPAATESVAQEPVATRPDRSSMMDDPKKAGSADEMAMETTNDDLKRKRRSASPTPKEESVKRRRDQGGAEDAAGEFLAPGGLANDSAAKGDFPTSENVAPDIKDSQATPVVPTDDTQEDVEMPPEDVGPARHGNTPAIYVNNLMRPMREFELRNYLVTLATPPGDERNDDVIVKFYVDPIRTHAFIVFTSATVATRVRNRLHGRVWPDESNRKALFVDFVPVDRVDDWVRIEENHTGRNKHGYRWEVVYEADGDGNNVEAILRSSSVMSSSAATLPAGRPAMPAVGPEGAPTGPRGYRASVDRAHSGMQFQAVPRVVADRRLQSMRGYYTSETTQQHNREINRYSFQEGAMFVDRGREVFEGIRPPHRQQAMDRQRGFGNGRGRGGGRAGRPPRRGPAPFWPRGDRYIPDRPPRYVEDDRLSRQRDDDRPPRYY